MTTWNTVTIDGKNYLEVDVAKFKIPLEWDPSSNMFFAVSSPDGGYGNIPALLQGDPGITPDIDTAVNFVPLAAGDPTINSASWTETSPNVYKLNLSVHDGATGATGTSVLVPTAYGTPVYKKILIVNAATTGFEYQTQKVGDRYFPASISSAPSGNAAYTLCTVGVAAQDFDWRPACYGTTVVTGTGADIRADVVARLQVGATSAETSGNIVGWARGVAGVNPPPHVLIPALRPGTYPPAADFDKIPAGSAATIYLRVERQTGGQTFTTSNTDTSFWVKVNPIP